MEACAFFLCRRDRTVGKVLLDKGVPPGALFIAPVQLEVHGKSHGATHIMTRDRSMREGIRGIAMIVMAINIVEEASHMLTQGIIKDQDPVSLWTTYLLSVLEEIDEPPVIDTVLEPRCFREEAGQVGFVSTLEHTAGDVRQAFVVQDDQPGQIILKVVKLAPILEEVPEDIGMSGHEGSGSHDRKLHEALPLHVGDGIGPESINSNQKWQITTVEF